MNPLSTHQVDQIINSIKPPSELWRQKARNHLDVLTKPLGSLGRLEDIAAQIVAIRQENFAERIKKAAYIFAADHGVSAEGVSAFPREVTHQMVLNYLSHGAAISVLARMHHAKLCIIDVGVDADFDDLPGLIRRKIVRGTRNMLNEPAMSDEHLAQALLVGAEMASAAVADGVTMIAIGEMGIGNTTCASAITCALTGATAAVATGRGSGIGPDAHTRKTDVVEAACIKHFGGASEPSPLEVLRCVGGLEIAAMTGMMLAAATHKLVIVIDGFICTAAAALAVAIASDVRGYLVIGHHSQEPGHKILLDYLKSVPVLSLDMRLGEATGAVLAMPILESAMALYNEMATFTSAGVSVASV